MDQLKEYHDPDYPAVPVEVEEEPRTYSEEEKIEKIKSIIHREFVCELEVREGEVRVIDQRMMQARRLLQKLRYNIVSTYYTDQKLQLNPAQIQDDVATQRDPKAKAEITSLLRDGQRKLHPSVRKLVGRQTADLEEILQWHGPRNKPRKDYYAMLQTRNYTVSADSTRTLRPEEETSPTPPPQDPPPPPKKVPRHLEPKPQNVVTLDQATRNQMKHRYRIIIGNTSKYVPAASRLDRSTHKWLLYVRGAPPAADPSPLLEAVRVTLHPSYAPHHTVLLHKHPFHVSRRGWGEFPAKVELHFVLPERNKPATLEHNIKLDRNYTGMQTLGSETIVDVWLYSTPEMLQYEYIEDNEFIIQNNIQTDEEMDIPPAPEHNEEVTDTQTDIQTDTQTDIQTDWMDFFKTPTELDVDEMFIKPIKKEPTELDVNEMFINPIKNEEIFTPPEQENQDDAMPTETETGSSEAEKMESILEVPIEIMNQPPSAKKRIVKYIDPTTGKIYYLEMDRELDLSKVQEIIINNTTAKISPIKSNGLKSVRKRKGVSLLKPEVKNEIMSEHSNKMDRIKHKFPHLDNDHCYLAGPSAYDKYESAQDLYDNIISVMYRFSDVRSAVNFLVKRIPLISERAWEPGFSERFPFVVENSDKYWRLDFAKRRNIEWSRAKLINNILTEHFPGPVWRTKQILLYLRLHGHHPVREAPSVDPPDWWDQTPGGDDTSLSIFKFDYQSLAEEAQSDEDVDVLSDRFDFDVKKEGNDVSNLTVLPVEREDDRLRFMYIERKCADIGIELRNEEVGNGYSYSCVHAVLLSAMKNFAEELLRGALAEARRADPPRVWAGIPSAAARVCPRAALRAARGGRLRPLSAADCAAAPPQTVPL